MLTQDVEKRLTRWIALGALGITLLVTDRVSNEPVNVGKMLLLVIVASASFALTLNYYKVIWRSQKHLFLIISLFLVFGLISIIFSADPWERGFYGAFGRNTGLLTYTSLSLVLLTTSFLKESKNLYTIIRALLITGLVNLVYCIAASQGYDVFKWKNPYHSILGTLGNPDFISAFLGIFVTALSGLIASRYFDKTKKTILFILILDSLYVIKESMALQGYIVSAAGISIILFLYLRSIIQKKWLLSSYLVLLGISGVVAILGTLQKGPLASLLYKPSVTFRGQYWHAGISMGFHNLLHGIGLDSFGTFYRAFRRSSAAIYPGVNVVTDTSHNVFIDIFAGVGIFGFICYLILIGFVLKAAFRIFKVQRFYDPIFSILFATWFTYELQSFISINQIGLAVWGWVLGGAMIAYSNITDREVQLSKLFFTESGNSRIKKSRTKKSEPSQISAGRSLSLFLGVVLGLTIGLPPFLADVKMRQALESKNPDRVISQTNSWPRDVSRTNRTIIELANNGMMNQARKLSLESITEFPKDYASWITLYQLTPDAYKEKAAYKVKLHELDPFNPEFIPK